MSNSTPDTITPPPRSRSDWPFYLGLAILTSVYVILIVAMIAAAASFTTPHHLLAALKNPAIRFSIRLSLLCCTLTTVLSLCVAIPAGYILSRFKFPGIQLLDALLDIPLVLPPLVVGLCLLILFQSPPGLFLQHFITITYAVPAVILAQFTVSCACAIRTMLATFDQISPRAEQVALTLGCTRAQAFWAVAIPEARRGILTAATLVWARSLGEFGPVLVFAGATRMRTEVLPTSVFLELSTGNIEAAVAVSLLMIVAALCVLAITRALGVKIRATGEHRL